jgi:hypothetical protein
MDGAAGLRHHSLSVKCIFYEILCSLYPSDLSLMVNHSDQNHTATIEQIHRITCWFQYRISNISKASNWNTHTLVRLDHTLAGIAL